MKKLNNRIAGEELETMNLMLDIQELTATRGEDVGWERKIVCPHCHKRTLLMKSNSKTGPYYKCLECLRAGDLNTLYYDLLGDNQGYEIKAV